MIRRRVMCGLHHHVSLLAIVKLYAAYRGTVYDRYLFGDTLLYVHGTVARASHNTSTCIRVPVHPISTNPLIYKYVDKKKEKEEKQKG